MNKGFEIFIFFINTDSWTK